MVTANASSNTVLASSKVTLRCLLMFWAAFAGSHQMTCLLPFSTRKQSKRAPRPAKLAGQWVDAALATDVMFELFDHELLLGNNRLDEIAN
jgi:hypothetical protein